MAMASLLLSAILFTPSPPAAGADREPGAGTAAPEVAAAAAPRTRWYGWQLLVSDIVFVGVIADAKDTKVTESAIGFAGLALGAPILHLANGNRRMGLASLLVRSLASGVVFAAVQSARDSGASDGAGSTYERTLILGVLGVAATLGGLIYVLIDDCALARVPVRAGDGSAPGGGPAARAPARSVVPIVFAGPRAGGAGVVALF
jgi:hypothetical protein